MIRRATNADLLAILGEPAAITRQELETIGLTRWQALKELRSCLKKGDGWTISHDGGLLFALGSYVDPFDPPLRQFWFVATQRYFDMGLAGFRIGARTLAFVRRMHPGVDFESVSWSKHPKAGQWFTLLGFRVVGRAADYTVYRLDAETHVGSSRDDVLQKV